MITFSTSQIMALVGAWLWPFLRLLALFMAAPLFSNRAIPTRVKIGLSIFLAALIGPTLATSTQVPLNHPQTFSLVAQQIMVGLAIGFALRLTLAAIEMAGELIGLQMGLSFSGFFDPQNQAGGNAVSSWLGVVATLIFLSINGHLLLIDALVMSFQLFPIGGPIFPIAETQKMLTLGGGLFVLALQLAMPFVVVLLIVNLALGVMGRVAPQLNLLSVGLPATIVVGMGALYLILPYLERPITRALEQGLAVLAN